ncbi:MAG: hypothetical protein GY730_06175 [bacterium]|nr:hypothetical protein [bacterium]
MNENTYYFYDLKSYENLQYIKPVYHSVKKEVRKIISKDYWNILVTEIKHSSKFIIVSGKKGEYTGPQFHSDVMKNNTKWESSEKISNNELLILRLFCNTHDESDLVRKKVVEFFKTAALKSVDELKNSIVPELLHTMFFLKFVSQKFAKDFTSENIYRGVLLNNIEYIGLADAAQQTMFTGTK